MSTMAGMENKSEACVTNSALALGGFFAKGFENENPGFLVVVVVVVCRAKGFGKLNGDDFLG